MEDPVDETRISEESVNAQREAERVAVEALFSRVRINSTNSTLTPEADWIDKSELPEHLSPTAFCDLVIAWLTPSEETGGRHDDAPPCEDITMVQGSNSAYLYASDLMTGNYASWCVLADENDAVATLVACAREESRLYPRPLLAQSLENPPFNLSTQQIAEAFALIQASSTYPDIETVSASNDEVYYFSTLYLSRPYARSLAETYSVKRFLNL